MTGNIILVKPISRPQRKNKLPRKKFLILHTYMKHFTVYFEGIIVCVSHLVDLETPMSTYPINLTAKQAKYIAREQL